MYLGYNSLSCAVVSIEEMVSLDEQLTRVFLFGCRPLPPQNDRNVSALLVQLCDPLFKKKLGMRREAMNWRRRSRK